MKGEARLTGGSDPLIWKGVIMGGRGNVIITCCRYERDVRKALRHTS